MRPRRFPRNPISSPKVLALTEYTDAVPFEYGGWVSYLPGLRWVEATVAWGPYRLGSSIEVVHDGHAYDMIVSSKAFGRDGEPIFELRGHRVA